MNPFYKARSKKSRSASCRGLTVSNGHKNELNGEAVATTLRYEKMFVPQNSNLAQNGQNDLIFMKLL